MSGPVLSAVLGTNRFCHVCRGVAIHALLAALVLAALGQTGFAELPKYLPDGCVFIVSVNCAEVYDSPAYQKLKVDIANFAADEKSFQDEIGLAPANLARVTVAGNWKLPSSGPGPGPIVTIGTRKPVSAAELRASRKSRGYQKDFSLNEIKVGEQSIYEATYHYSWDEGKGELKHGESFAVLPDNVVLFGESGDALRKVLARGKAATLSPELQGAIDATDFNKTLAYVFDLKAAAGDEAFARIYKREFGALFGDVANSDVLKKLTSLSVDGSVQGSEAAVRAVLTAGDTETASDVKKIVEAAQVMLRGTLQKVPRIPKEVVDAINGVTFTVDGNKLIAAGKVKVDAVVHWIESENEYQKKQAEERAKASQPLPPRRPVEK